MSDPHIRKQTVPPNTKIRVMEMVFDSVSHVAATDDKTSLQIGCNFVAKGCGVLPTIALSHLDAVQLRNCLSAAIEDLDNRKNPKPSVI